MDFLIKKIQIIQRQVVVNIDEFFKYSGRECDQLKTKNIGVIRRNVNGFLEIFLDERKENK